MPRPPNQNIARAADLAAKGYAQDALRAPLAAAGEEGGACLYVRHADAAALLEAPQASVEALDAVALAVADGINQPPEPDEK
jgi:hypothetical protein